MKKILFTIVAIGLLFSFVHADEDQYDLKDKYNGFVSVYVMSTEYGATPWNTALGVNVEDPNTDHPGDLECTWWQNGLTFMTWFIDSSEGYISTDTFFPGDGAYGHDCMDLGDGTNAFYFYALDNFFSQGRMENVEVEDGDTLHMNFRFQGADGKVYYACFDTVFHGFPGDPIIMVDLATDPGSLTCCIYHVCSPCPWLGIEEKEPTTPQEYYLAQNSPNPFNSRTAIEYFIPENADVTIDVYDLRGNKVNTLINEYQTEGSYMVKWDATDTEGNIVPTGSYFYKITAGEYETQKRMLFIK